MNVICFLLLLSLLKAFRIFQTKLLVISVIFKILNNLQTIRCIEFRYIYIRKFTLRFIYIYICIYTESTLILPISDDLIQKYITNEE